MIEHGHLTEDTLENRTLLKTTAEDRRNHVGTDKFGNEVYARRQSDGSEIWVEVRGGIIHNGGVNHTPRYSP